MFRFSAFFVAFADQGLPVGDVQGGDVISSEGRLDTGKYYFDDESSPR